MSAESSLANKTPRSLIVAALCYAITVVLALVCLADTTALSMTAFFFLGLGALAIGFIAYAKLVWDDLRAHGVF